MRTIADIRHDRLMELIQEYGSVQTLADRLGKQHSQIQQLKNRAAYGTAGGRRAVGTTLAREIEAKLEKPVGWMDSDPKSCCTGGEPTEYRESPLQSASFRQSVWRGAASRLLEHCKASRVTLDAETFLDVVDAAVEQVGEDMEKADTAFRVLLQVAKTGRAIGHTQV